MINHIEKFRRQISEGKLCLGAGVTLNDPCVIEALAPAMDFVWIDMEHCPMGIETLLGHLVAARAGGVPAIVRVPGSDVPFLKRVLDTGAEGIIVPQVRSSEEVQQVVDACRYPPLGKRGWGPRRPSGFGQRSQEQIVQESNEQLFVAAQIENVDAVESLNEIVAIAGLDSLVVGPYDLSASLGVLGQLDHPRVVEAIEKIIAAAQGAGLCVGFGDEAVAESSQRWAKMGANWIQCGCDFAYMTSFAQQLFSAIRS